MIQKIFKLILNKVTNNSKLIICKYRIKFNLYKKIFKNNKIIQYKLNNNIVRYKMMLTKLKFKYNIRLTNKIIFQIKRFKSILRYKFTKEIVKLKKVK